MKNKNTFNKSLIFILVVVLLSSHCSRRQKEGYLNVLSHETGNEYLDIFMADGDSMIIRPQHLGIVNGMASVGISHDYVGMIDGFWAQPYVSSDFFIEPRIFGERIKTEHYTWLPYQAKCHGKLKGIDVMSTTTLIYGIRAGIHYANWLANLSHL